MTTTPEPPTEPSHDTATVTLIDRAVRRTILRLVLPAFLAGGVGLSVSLYLNWRDQQDRIHDQCVTAVENRDNFRTFAFGQQDQWDHILEIFPPSSPAVRQIQAIADDTRADIDQDFPALKRSEC